MVDREAATMRPPPPEQRDMEAEHKALTLELADHPDPKVRILAHLSTRQFELSERLADLARSTRDGFDELKREMRQGFSDLKDKVLELDNGFTDVEERTSLLEEQHPNSLNGNSSQPQ